MNIIKRLINLTFQTVNPDTESIKAAGIVLWEVAPMFRNGEVILYCHGGFDVVNKPPDWGDVNFFASHGYKVFIIRFQDEFGNPKDAQKDIDDVRKIGVALAKRYPVVHLIGVSRGGYVALQSMDHSLFRSCAVAAPPSTESWLEHFKSSKERNPEFVDYFSKLPFPIIRAEELSKSNILFIAGRDDTLVPPWSIKELVNRIEDYSSRKFHILKQFNDGHGVMSSKKAKRFVLEFLKDV